MQSSVISHGITHQHLNYLFSLFVIKCSQASDVIVLKEHQYHEHGLHQGLDLRGQDQGLQFCTQGQVGGLGQWLERRSITGELSLAYPMTCS